MASNDGRVETSQPAADEEQHSDDHTGVVDASGGGGGGCAEGGDLAEGQPMTDDNKEQTTTCAVTETNGDLADEGDARQLLEPQDYDDSTSQPLSERWSPVGANYDDAVALQCDLFGGGCETASADISGAEDTDKGDALDGDFELLRLRHLEDEQELLTTSLMALTSHFAHVQLRVRQIVEAPTYERDQLLKDLEEFAFRGIPDPLFPSTTAAAVAATTAADSSSNPCAAVSPHDVESSRQRQFELIEHLKAKLSELENFAYDSGVPVLPQHVLLEKQKLIIDELKNRLNLRVDERELPALTAEQLKCHVDSAIGEFVGPMKMKEQLVAQLKTQIADLERFIAFLQCESDDTKVRLVGGGGGGDGGAAKCGDVYNTYSAKKKCGAARRSGDPTVGEVRPSVMAPGRAETLNSKAHGLLDKASVLMQIFASTHLGPKAAHFQKNTLKKTAKGDHWGDLRAQLEVDIQEVASLAATLNYDKEKLAKMRTTLAAKGGRPASADCNGGRDGYDWASSRKRVAHSARHSSDSINLISRELTAAVRKNFAITLQRLIQHGLRSEAESATSSLMVPFMRCFNPTPVFAAAAETTFYFRDTASSSSSSSSSSFMAPAMFAAATAAPASGDEDGGDAGDMGDMGDMGDTDDGPFSFLETHGSRQMHAWELVMEYYYLKHGDEYNNTPARKLSQSFNLDIVGGGACSAKQSLLSTIGTIVAMHRPYKRSYDAHFKAFVCAALNVHKLVEWLYLIVGCGDLVDTYYTPTSYVARTGFRDALRSIDALTKYDFDLPVDLAVRHFRYI